MAYQKIVVNTNLASQVLASDINHIPDLPNVAVVTGTSQAVTSGTTDGFGTNLCVDSAGGFEKTSSPFPVVVGDTVFNTTVAANQVVTSVTDTTLGTGVTQIFTGAAGGQDYLVVRSNVLIDTSKDFGALGVNAGDLVYNTTSDTQALVTFVNGNTITLDTDIFGTETTSDDAYRIFLAGGKNAPPTVLDSADCCLLYVGSSTAAAAMTLATQYVDIKVLTCGNNEVTFKNFKVGEYLPIQIKQLFSTGTTPEARNECLAIW